MDNTVSPDKPSPQTTLVIFLGASNWPYHPQLTSSRAFSGSANKVRTYFCNPRLFGLPPENWLDLFDQYQNNPNEVDQRIGHFLNQRISALKQAGTPAKDVLFYYIGHGVFTLDAAQAYHLAILSTREANIGASAVAMASLAHTLKTHARHLRRIVILDCCFAAKSFPYLAQSAVEQAAQLQLQSAFEEKSKGSGFPKKGTVLLCSSGQQERSFILPDESGTMFSESLIRTLTLGNVRQPSKTHLSLYELKLLTEDVLEKLTKGSAPKPFISSPDQSDGDVALVPFFPNPCAQQEQVRRAEEEKRHRVAEAERQVKSKADISPFLPSRLPIQPTDSVSHSPSLIKTNTPPKQILLPHQPSTPLNQIPVPNYFPPFNTTASPSQYPPIAPQQITLAKRPGITRRGLLSLAGLMIGGGVLLEISSHWTSLFKTHYPLGKLLFTYKGHSDQVNTVTWSPDSTRIASGSNDGTIQMWDAADGSHSSVYRASSTGVYVVVWSPDGKLLASAANDSTIHVWDAAGGNHPFTYQLSSAVVIRADSLAWSPDSKRIASVTGDGMVQVWDATSGGHSFTYNTHSSAISINSVAWSPNGTRIACGGLTTPVQVWDATNGGHLFKHSNSVNAIAWSPNSKQIASGNGSTVEVWDAADGSNSFFYPSWDKGNNEVISISWSPDGTRIASAYSDNTVDVWDATDGGHSFTYQGLGSGFPMGVTAVAWSPDGTRIASASGNNTVLVWGSGL